VTFGRIQGRDHGADGTGSWTAFNHRQGCAGEGDGEGEFNAPANQLAAIKAKTFGKYVDRSSIRAGQLPGYARHHWRQFRFGCAETAMASSLAGVRRHARFDHFGLDFNKATPATSRSTYAYILWNK